MNSHKKVRIILANNPTASLFMASWFVQNNYDKDASWENIAIYSAIDLDDTYSENIEEKKKIYEQISFNVLRHTVNAWYGCAPSEYDTYHFVLIHPLRILKERNKRIKDLQKIRNVLEIAHINLKNVKEVWLCSNCFAPHFKFLCKNARFIAFEHGLSDLRPAIKINARSHKKEPPTLQAKRFYKLIEFNKYYLHYLLNFVRGKCYSFGNWLEPRLIFFKKNFQADEYISIFGKEINQINNSNDIKTIHTHDILNVAGSLIKSDGNSLALANLEGKTAVILLESIKPFSYNKKELFSFYKDFEQYLVKFWINIFHEKKIKNIIFKSRFFFEEQTDEAFEQFEQLRKHFNLIMLSNYSPLNYSIEYYLSLINPVIILGAYSSGLFYAKKIVPDLEIYTYDDWYVEYCKKNYNTAHDDFRWLHQLFESDALRPFEKYVPKTLSHR